MVENNDKGRMVRRYFIEAEKRYNDLKLIHARSKAERRLFTDVLKETLPESPNKKWAYKYYTDLVYKIVTGKNAKQLRELYGLSQDDNVRSKLSPQELREVMNFERIIESLLELGHNYDNIKDIVSAPALKAITPS
jgi:predicted patatin/cPLA2 family phospholipase